MAALTTQSQLTAVTTAATSSLVASAIQQLNTNQQSMMQQMAAFTSTTLNSPTPAFQVPFHAPPFTHFSIPAIGAIQGVGTCKHQGNNFGGHQGHGRHTPCSPFANYTTRNALGGIPSVATAGEFTPTRGRGGAGVLGASHSNIIKQYANMHAVNVGLVWKMATCPNHAPHLGVSQPSREIRPI